MSLKKYDIVTVHHLNGETTNAMIVEFPTKDYPFWQLQVARYYMNDDWKLNEDEFVVLQHFQYMTKLSGKAIRNFSVRKQR